MLVHRPLGSVYSSMLGSHSRGLKSMTGVPQAFLVLPKLLLDTFSMGWMSINVAFPLTTHYGEKQDPVQVGVRAAAHGDIKIHTLAGGTERCRCKTTPSSS